MCVHDCVNFVRTGFSVFQPGLMFKKKKEVLLDFFLQVATAVEKWKFAIREAQTFSRMHVLLGMLDACIKWDMSAENARCKVCRKKGTTAAGLWRLM